MATHAIPMAKIPQPKVNHLEALTISVSDFSDVLRLYKSIVVVDAKAFNSLEVLDIAALNMTASNNPINPRGKLLRMKVINM